MKNSDEPPVKRLKIKEDEEKEEQKDDDDKKEIKNSDGPPAK